MSYHPWLPWFGVQYNQPFWYQILWLCLSLEPTTSHTSAQHSTAKPKVRSQVRGWHRTTQENECPISGLWEGIHDFFGLLLPLESKGTCYHYTKLLPLPLPSQLCEDAIRWWHCQLRKILLKLSLPLQCEQAYVGCKLYWLFNIMYLSSSRSYWSCKYKSVPLITSLYAKNHLNQYIFVNPKSIQNTN